MRKLLVCASLALGVAAFAVPPSASAIWTDNHQHIPFGANPVVHTEGTWQWTSPLGGTHCQQVTMTMQLTGGTTTEHIQQFEPNLASCKTTGGLAQCTITSMTIENLPWTGHVSGTGITQTGVTIQKHLHGVLCPQTLQLQTTAQHHMTIHGEETGNTQGHTTINGLKISGALRIKETNQTLTIAGTFTPTASQSHRFGWT